MKKVLSCIAVILCVVLCVSCFAACASTTSKCITPEFSSESQGYTIEFVNNMEKDFDFPIEGVKLSHETFQNDGSLEYSWIIKDAQGELVGWIEIAGGYESDKKGNYKYGFFAADDVWGTKIFNVILKGTDLSVFDLLTVQSDLAKVEKFDADYNPELASKYYIYFDADKGENISRDGSENFVVCAYELDLTGVGDEVENIKISLKFGN